MNQKKFHSAVAEGFRDAYNDEATRPLVIAFFDVGKSEGMDAESSVKSVAANAIAMGDTPEEAVGDCLRGIAILGRMS